MPAIRMEDRRLLAAKFVKEQKVWIEWACRCAEQDAKPGSNRRRIQRITALIRRRWRHKALDLCRWYPEDQAVAWAVGTLSGMYPHQSAQNAAMAAKNLTTDETFEILASVIEEYRR